MGSSTSRAARRRGYLEAGAASLKEYERTGIAYAIEDVERYILAISAGKKRPRPKPIKVSRSKS